MNPPRKIMRSYRVDQNVYDAAAAHAAAIGEPLSEAIRRLLLDYLRTAKPDDATN